MLLVTQRRKVGVICGHAVYSITKSEILPLSDSTKASSVNDSKNENRSFVNSACECQMYLVFFGGHKDIRSQKLLVNHCIMVVSHLSFIYLYL